MPSNCARHSGQESEFPDANVQSKKQLCVHMLTWA